MSDEVTIYQEGQVVRIDVKLDRLDAAAASRIKPAFAELPVQGVDQVVIDLEPVRFIDSSGVGILLGIYRKFPSDQVSADLANTSPPVRSVLELLRLHKIFRIG